MAGASREPDCVRPVGQEGARLGHCQSWRAHPALGPPTLWPGCALWPSFPASGGEEGHSQSAPRTLGLVATQGVDMEGEAARETWPLPRSEFRVPSC